MSRILVLSNGHGEDLSGSLLAKYFVKKGDLVDALPIVGDGENYKKINIRIIGKTKKFRTGGIGYNSFRGRIFEIFGGQIIYFFKKLYLSYKLRNKYDFYLVIGDIVPVFFAWFAKKDFFIYLVAYSSHYEGKLKLPWPCKFFLISKYAKKIYARDFLTANDLTQQLRKKVSFLGNPFMDKFSFFENKSKTVPFNIGLFPGSRFPELLDNLKLILEVLETMSKLKYFENIAFKFAIVKALSMEEIRQILKQRKWIYVEKKEKNDGLEFTYGFITVHLNWNLFEEILFKSNFVISMAGTASEQAIGLAKPVIQIEGNGPQFTKSFAEAQRRLLGRYVFCSTNYINKKDQINQTINLILKVIYLIKIDKKFLISCLDNANQRIGESNSCIKIINDIKGFHEK